MPRKLNATSCHGAPVPPAGKRSWVWDSDLRGFGLRVYPTGERVFYLKYRAGGDSRTRLHKIGRFGDITPEFARKAAAKLRAAVALGADPAQEKAELRAARTVGSLFPEFLSGLTDRAPRTVRGYTLQWEGRIRPVLGNVKCAHVTRDHIHRLHQSLIPTKVEANRTRSLLHSFFTWAALNHFRVRGDPNPVTSVKKYGENKRKVKLTDVQRAALGAAIKAVEAEGTFSSTAMNAIRLIGYVGLRPGEAMSLRWVQLDWEQCMIRLRKTKTGDSTRPFNATARELVATQPREDGNPYVFPGRMPNTHIQTLRDPWERIRKLAELEDVAGLGPLQLRDLRHNFATTARKAGESLLDIAGAIGHRGDPAQTLTYAEEEEQAVLAMADRTGAAVKAAWDGHPGLRLA